MRPRGAAWAREAKSEVASRMGILGVVAPQWHAANPAPRPAESARPCAEGEYRTARSERLARRPTSPSPFTANKFWELPPGQERAMTAKAFFHLHLADGALLVTWRGVRERRP